MCFVDINMQMCLLTFKIPDKTNRANVKQMKILIQKWL